MPARPKTLLATLTLLGITAAWGSTFFLIKDLLERVPTLDFLGIRFAIAAVALVLVAPRALGRLSREARRHAIVLGLLYGLGQILQTAGLAHTPASVSGFITGLYVVATPLFAAVLLHTRITWLTWAAVLLAVIGLAVLTLDGLSVGYGEALTFVAAMLYALHIVGLGAWSTATDAMGLAILQLIVIAVVCLYMALIPGALGIVGQTWAQAHLPPTRTAIVMSMEPVFAAFFAVLLGGESLTSRMLLGGVFVVAAMLVVELGPRRHVEGEVTHLTV